jgi:hypothetical protein
MTPFHAAREGQSRRWMAARNGRCEYGKLRRIPVSEAESRVGPKQIVNRINQ